jgi:hypothetical protein
MATVQLNPQAEKELAELMYEYANDKEQRPIFGEWYKNKKGRVLPDVEAASAVQLIDRRFEQEKAEREKEKALAKLEAQRESLKSRYDDTALGEIEKLMEKHGISDYDLAARLYASETQAATPTYEVNDHTWSMPNFGKDFDIKDSAKMKQRNRGIAMQVIDEFKRKRAS